MKKLLLILFLCGSIFSQVNHTGWPLELLSWIVNKAYPGVEYNYRLGIKGGEYPYRFYLRQGPTGMTIDSIKGVITWTPATATVDSVRVTVKDNKGDSLVVQYDITATTSGFYFVDSADGNNANAGTEASPWATMAYASATADSSSYVYVKKGTYTTDSFTISATKCGRFMAYPGDTVFVNSTASGDFSISINAGSKRLFQGFNFDGNGLRWLFSVGGYTKNVIWRNNTIHNVGDGGSGNPAGMFFWDAGGNPITGGDSYDKIVVQDNIFYDLNGSSIVSFDVKNMLFENNIVHDIPSGPGNGVSDKAMGYMNTFRGNLIYNCQDGIVLMAQGGQSNIEICYNHMYGITDFPIVIGLQNAYLEDIFVHHNTVNGSIKLYGYGVNYEESNNINIYKNIIGKGAAQPYLVSGVDNNWPANFFSKVSVDSNIVYGLSNGTNVSGYGYGIPNLSWTQWRDSGQDNNSKYLQLTYDSNNIPILDDSLKIYGAFGVNLSFDDPEEPPSPPVTAITTQPRDTTVSSGSTVSFTVAGENINTYQWYGNNALISGATGTTYSFTATTELNGTAIYCIVNDTLSSDTVTLTVVSALVKRQSTDTLKLLCSVNNATAYQWYRSGSAISGATDSVLKIPADSAIYKGKFTYHCQASNSVSSLHYGDWTLGVSGNKRVFNFKRKY